MHGLSSNTMIDLRKKTYYLKQKKTKVLFSTIANVITYVHEPRQNTSDWSNCVAMKAPLPSIGKLWNTEHRDPEETMTPCLSEECVDQSDSQSQSQPAWPVKGRRDRINHLVKGDEHRQFHFFQQNSRSSAEVFSDLDDVCW